MRRGRGAGAAAADILAGTPCSLHRAMTPDDRIRLADEMSTDVRELARAGIRARMPEGATAAEIDAELVRMLTRRAASTR